VPVLPLAPSVVEKAHRLPLGVVPAGVTTLHAAGRYDHPALSDAFEFLDSQMGMFNAHFSGHYFFYYGHYYAVQAYYTAGGPKFRNYFLTMRDLLIDMQESDGSPSTSCIIATSSGTTSKPLRMPTRSLGPAIRP